MAKLALINRNEKRRKTVKKYAAKRAELFAIANNPKLAQEERYEARLKLQKLPRDASSGAAAQPLRADRPSARHVPQVRAGAQQAARDRDARRDPGRDQGELVGEAAGENCMSMSDPIADMLTRIRNAQHVGKTVGGDARVEAEGRRSPRC